MYTKWKSIILFKLPCRLAGRADCWTKGFGKTMLPLVNDWQNYASSELSAEQLPDGKSATYGADVAKV